MYRIGQLVRIISAVAYPHLVGRETVILAVHADLHDLYLTAAIAGVWARSRNLEPVIFSDLHSDAKEIADEPA
jgi:hypothetical protein